MTIDIKPGQSRTLNMEVKSADSAKSFGSGLLEVLATPAMIAFMERTSMELVQKYLPPGFGTVGTRVDVRHIKASSIGAKIECTATIIDYDNRKLQFEVLVKEKGIIVGSGVHDRYIIEEEKFLQNL